MKRRCHCGHSAAAHAKAGRLKGCRACQCPGYYEIYSPWLVLAICAIGSVVPGGLIFLIFGWPIGMIAAVLAALLISRLIFESIVPAPKPDYCRECGVVIGEMHTHGCSIATGPFVSSENFPEEK